MAIHNVVQTASLLCAAAGIACVLVEARSFFKRGLPLALDFWLAAGLLRLSETSTWPAIATAGLIVVIRKTIGLALARRV